MMPPGDTPSKPTATTKTCSPNTKDNENSDQQGGGGGDGGGRKTTKAAAAEQGLKCPRCDSPNTKFCYYNNYSLTQPRHFCKTCRRYWTKGGALRNVPIGGGCRKSKKGKPSSSSSSISYSRAFSCDSARDSGSSSDLSGLRYLHGLSSPPMDFHLGGLTFPIPSRLQHHQQPPMATTAAFYSNQFSSFGDVVPGATTTASASSAIDYPSGSSLIGLNYPFCSSDGNGSNGAIIHGGMNNNFEGSSSLASSIESLSSLNQDLHWKLQQQRLAMLFVGDNQHKDDHNNSNGNGNVSFSPVVVDLDHHHHHHHHQQQQQQQRPQPILFENLEISKAGAAATTVDADTRATEWFFGNSHAHTPTTTTSSGCNGHEDSWMMSSSGVHGWPDLQPHPQQQYSSLP